MLALWNLGLIGLLGLLIAGAAPVRPAYAQSRTASRGVCFRDRPDPPCRMSVVYAAAAYAPIAATEFDDVYGKTQKALTSHSDFSLGVLWNVGERDAFGLGVGAGWGISSYDTDFERNDIHATYRRWFKNGMALDVSTGFLRADVRDTTFGTEPVRRSGANVSVDLHYKHWAIATVRGDFMSGDAPSAKAVYVGLKFDSYPGLIMSAVAAVAYAAGAMGSGF